jgi:hypothetical protein
VKIGDKVTWYRIKAGCYNRVPEKILGTVVAVFAHKVKIDIDGRNHWVSLENVKVEKAEEEFSIEGVGKFNGVDWGL